MLDTYVNACGISMCVSILLAAVLLDHSYVGGCEVNKIKVFKGWTSSSASISYTAVTMAQCAANITRDSVLEAYVPLAIYNRASFDCKILTSMPDKNLILQDSDDDNEMILWNESGCEQFKDVVKEYVDSDIPGYDSCYQPQPTMDECMVFCGDECPSYKGFAYNYDNTSPRHEACYCKTITKAEYGILRAMPSWNYYERLC